MYYQIRNFLSALSIILIAFPSTLLAAASTVTYPTTKGDYVRYENREAGFSIVLSPGLKYEYVYGGGMSFSDTNGNTVLVFGGKSFNQNVKKPGERVQDSLKRLSQEDTKTDNEGEFFEVKKEPSVEDTGVSRYSAKRKQPRPKSRFD